MGLVDLHVHTSASDGVLSPRAVVELAVQVGLRYLGITDHDSTEGIKEAQSAANALPMEVIPGVEINAEFARSELHVLGYLADPDAPSLQDVLSKLRAGRLTRARSMVSRLASLGLSVEWDRIADIAGNGAAVGRPHVAQALVEQGHVGSVEEAFRGYLGRGCPAYVERFKLSPAEAIEAVRAAKGIPVLAHPLSLMDAVPELVKAGLAGLEAYYTGYSDEETLLLVQLASKYGLLVTGGSDFHGEDVLPNAHLGGVSVPVGVIPPLMGALSLSDG